MDLLPLGSHATSDVMPGLQLPSTISTTVQSHYAYWKERALGERPHSIAASVDASVLFICACIIARMKPFDLFRFVRRILRAEVAAVRVSTKYNTRGAEINQFRYF